jgi:hypothetical protein
LIYGSSKELIAKLPFCHDFDGSIENFWFFDKLKSVAALRKKASQKSKKLNRTQKRTKIVLQSALKIISFYHSFKCQNFNLHKLKGISKNW